MALRARKVSGLSRNRPLFSDGLVLGTLERPICLAQVSRKRLHLAKKFHDKTNFKLKLNSKHYTNEE